MYIHEQVHIEQKRQTYLKLSPPHVMDVALVTFPSVDLLRRKETPIVVVQFASLEVEVFAVTPGPCAAA